MYILVQKGPKCFIICPQAKNGRSLIRNISPLNRLLMLGFEWQVDKGVVIALLCERHRDTEIGRE